MTVLFVFTLLSHPIVTLKSLATNKERADPAEEGKTAKDTPCERLALGSNVDREREQTARYKGSDTATQR